MQINVQTRGVIITSKQRSQMERQLSKLKKYMKDVSPVMIDLTLIDESGPEKGGIDQAVHINVILPGEKIFIEEVDDRIVRAFGFAVKTLERRLRRYSQKRVGDQRRKASRFKSLTNAVGFVGRIVPRRRKK